MLVFDDFNRFFEFVINIWENFNFGIIIKVLFIILDGMIFGVLSSYFV